MATLVAIPEYTTTPLDAIPGIASTARGAFRTHKTKNLQWRKRQLQKLYWALVDYEPQLLAALKQDLHKSDFEAHLTEVDWVKNDCLFMLKNLENFAKDDKLGAPHVPWTFSMMKFRIRKEPVGTALIIGPYNFPVQLVLSPLVGAIAAGCATVVKPSEMAPACAAVVKEMIDKCLDPSTVAIVNGGIPETNALMNEKWDKIFFTGSAPVGTIIAKKAAETLTPVVLELGGKNPAFISKHANLALAAKRLMWGKTMNAGQVCLSQNYVLIEKDLVPTFIEHLKQTYKEMFPNGAKASPDLGRIINQRHFLRLKKMLDDTKGKIVVGGGVDEAEKFIEPTVVLVDSVDDSMMQEESFGPIWSIYPVNSMDEALNVANAVHRTPLSLFSFGNKADHQRILNEMTSGGATLNDAFFHASLNTVPFGGTGDSGWGSYRGKASFDCFSHFRTVSETPLWAEFLINVRYMPFDLGKLRQLNKLTGGKPNFDRNGRPIRGLAYWSGLLLGLGSKDAKGALLRWAAVCLAHYFYTERAGYWDYLTKTRRAGY